LTSNRLSLKILPKEKIIYLLSQSINKSELMGK
jgi:hypothetical protein